MNRIDELFARLRSERRKAFIAFVTAGDPDIVATASAIRELDAAGCHLVEIGFPFSDPIADGPVIQASYTRALERGLKLDDIFAASARLTDGAQAIRAPLVGMVSYTLIYRRDPASFVQVAKRSGMAGLIVPDLPAEEADEFAAICRTHDIKSIFLISPTTPPRRAERIVKLSTGFLYCISVAGITGERVQLPSELLGQLRRLRQMTDLPLCVGFGVSKPEHIRMLREEADGVIVGSAIVRRMEKGVSALREFVTPLLAELNPV